MIIADYLKIGQKKFSSRLWIALPLFVVSMVLTQIDFELLWRYFNWANQSTAVIALFVGSMYLYIAGKNYFVALVPGTFMLVMVITYILSQPIGFNLPMNISWGGGFIGAALLVVLFFKAAAKARANNIPLEVDVSDWKQAS